MSVRLTKRAIVLPVGAVALFAVGTNVQAGWVFAISALLLGISVLGLLGPFRALTGVEVTRHPPSSSTAGEAVDVTLRVRNGARGLRGAIRVEDDFLGTGTGVVPYLWPGEEVDLVGPRTPRRRGVYTSGTCTLLTGAPFGVLLVRKAVPLASTTVVYPRTFDTRSSARFGGGGTAHANTDDVATIREYRPGDPLRHVHWRSTARHGNLMVREFEAPSQPEVLVVADVGDDPIVADAVASVACSLAIGALRDGHEVRVWPDGNAPQTTSTILEWGARLQPRIPSAVDGGDAFVVRISGALSPPAPDDRGEVVHVTLDNTPSGSGVRSVTVAEVAALVGGEASW